MQFITILLLLLFANPAWATYYYVDNTSGHNGSDSNAGTTPYSSPGSPGTSWLTIQKAANTMVAGDNVTIAAGTYAERVTITTSGTNGNPIAYNGAQVGNVVMLGFQINANYNTLSYFTVATKTASRTTGAGVWVQGSNNIINFFTIHDLCWEGIVLSGNTTIGTSPAAAGTSNNLVYSNAITKARHAGIHVEGQSNTIDANDITGTIQNPSGCSALTGTDGDGIHVFGTSQVLSRNYVHDIPVDGVENVDPHSDCVSTTGPLTSATIEKNFCLLDYTTNPFTNAVTADDTNGDVTSLTVRNNIFRGSTYGVFLSSVNHDLSGVVIVNNDFVNTNKEGVYFQVSVHSAILKNNINYDVGLSGTSYFCSDSINARTGLAAGYNNHYMTSGSAVAVCGGPYSADTLNTNPLLIDITAKNYHLAYNSPLRNMGATLSQATTDMLGRTRPISTAYDVGAYEEDLPHAPADPTAAAADFAARCAAAGVLTCHGFDVDATDFIQNTNIHPDGFSVFRGARDTTIKASGAGSLLFTLPYPPHSGQNIAGQWGNFGTPTFGQTFSQNSTFYVQYRMRLSPEMTHQTWDVNHHWKTMVLFYGNAECASLDLVHHEHYVQGITDFYTQCGGISVYSNPTTGLYTATTPFNIQAGDYNCAYGGDYNTTDCYYMLPDQWLTFYHKIHVGTWGVANSTIEVWIQRQGDAGYKKIVDTAGFTFRCNNEPCDQSPNQDIGFNNITLLPYMTSLYALDGLKGATSYMWFDELIISTAAIAAPIETAGGGGGGEGGGTSSKATGKVTLQGKVVVK